MDRQTRHHRRRDRRQARPRPAARALASAGVVALATSAAWVSWLASQAPCDGPHDGSVVAGSRPTVVAEGIVMADAAVAADALAGIWWADKGELTADRLRFYYFHGDGTGLYRYGQVGASYTHSFDYTVEGDALSLRFRKTGDAHAATVVLRHGADGGRDTLTITPDPRADAPTQYFRLASRRGPGLAEADALRSPVPAPSSELGPAPAGHMWIDLTQYATGGQGFYFYQLRPAGIDGRGVGWFHRGDFDEWSTEALTYRIVEDPRRLELSFSLAGTQAVTPISIAPAAGEGQPRRLRLHHDPRDFGRAHSYRDAGRSFGSVRALEAAGLDPRLAPVVAQP